MPDRIADARPSILLDNEETESIRQGMLSLLVVEQVQGLSRCELQVGNYGTTSSTTDFLYFDRRTLDFGMRLRVALGDATLFSGRISAIEARFPATSPPSIVVLAEDAMQELRMTRRTRSFLDSSDTQVFEQIADDHGLRKDVSLGGAGQVQHRSLAQVNQSDLAFLRDRARAIEAELWVDSEGDGPGTLHARPRADRARGTPLELGLHNELQEFQVIADLAHQRTAVVVGGWDVANKSAIVKEAGDAEIAAELGSDESGASILRARLWDRKETLAHGVVLGDGEAEARAAATFRMGARRFVTGSGVVRTTDALRVGRQLNLTGLGALFSGKYYLAEVRHRFDGVLGLRSEITVERPGLGRP